MNFTTSLLGPVTTNECILKYTRYILRLIDIFVKQGKNNLMMMTMAQRCDGTCFSLSGFIMHVQKTKGHIATEGKR